MGEELNIPRGWACTSLEKIASWGSGGTPARNVGRYFQGTIPWIKTGELGIMYIREAAEHITEEALNNSSAKIFPKGSVGIAMYGATIGKLSIWGIDASTNQACAVGIPTEAINNEFLYYFLLAEKQKLIKAGKGGAQPNISQGIVKEWPINLPPLSEQHRIVAKIEELFSELDKGIENLKTARAQLKVYRQALLKHAFEGKLTAQWRAENQDKLETADALLKRIQQERAQRYQQQLAEWEKGKSPSIPLLQRGKTTSAATTPTVPHFEKVLASVPPFGKGGIGGISGGTGGISKPKAPKPLPPLTAEELAELPELPEGWGWTRFGLLDIELKRGPFGSAITKSMFVPSGFKVFEQGNAIYRDAIRGNYFIDAKKFEELSGFAVLPGDFIVSCAGTVGKIFELPEHASAGVINQALMRVRLNESILSKRFFAKLFESGFFQRKVLSDAKGTAMVNLAGIKELNLVLVAICGLSEQRVIDELLEARLSEVDQLELTITTSLQQAEALRQSILKKAFSGQLVSQDPHDEPASKLLARIKAERAKSPLTPLC